MRQTDTSPGSPDRRTLTFQNFSDLERELRSLEAGRRAGTLRTSGRWTPGQILAHLAAFMEYPFVGYPPELNPPWIIRAAFKLMRRRVVRKPMRSGVRIPGLKQGTVGADPMDFDEALARLRAAAQRLDRDAPSLPNPLLGPLTHDEWKSLNLRHCELHLGFLHAQ